MLGKSFKYICAVILAISACSCNISVQNGGDTNWENSKWIDLSHAYSSKTISWPNSIKFSKEAVFQGQTDKGYYYEAFNFATAEHSGTHMDAPVHFAQGKRTVDQIPLSQLIAKACVLDLTERIVHSSSADYEIDVDDILSWEENFGMIPDGSVVLFYTGYSKLWDDATEYLGTGLTGEPALTKMHFPGLDPEAAKWLVQNRKIKAVGIDTASIDHGQSRFFESHRVLAENSLIIFENLANLDSLPPQGTLIIALPMKIKDGSGAPARIIARVSV